MTSQGPGTFWNTSPDFGPQEESGTCCFCTLHSPGLCLAFHESRFDTGTVDHEADGSTDNGIFQINSRLWCEDYKSSARNLCHMHCSDLLTSNINDDIVCAMQIVQQPRGLGAWLAWRKHCEGRDLSQWVEGCNVGSR
ncbi:sperm acrosome membrane-associated protein 3-like isoform X3 [Pelodiscus sinensis]|uniref:sperm acrosome membrane-associated protein 3-like isoform X3 n=1 Tax=Pelodiscus sinensis TaxID=13735 RepID=UPI003F6BFE3A